MENLLQGIPHVVVYLDDILITGPTQKEHLKSLEKVLSRILQAGLRLKRNKCSFMEPSVVYLGHKIDCEGLYPVADKVKAVHEAPPPRNISELKSYLGLLSYYSKFLPNLSTALAPLYLLLRKTSSWQWGTRQQRAFEASKKMLTSTNVLVHFDPKEELVLSCDASRYGIGAVLSHKFEDGSEKPVGFVSRSLSSAEKNYSQMEKEGLACVFGVKRFHAYVYGHHFTLVTDHKPLLSLFNEQKAVPSHASARIQRWALTLAMYEYKIKYRCTADHSNADAMSRLPLQYEDNPTPVPPEMVLLMEQLATSPVSADRVRAWTHTDPLLSRVFQYIQSGWSEVIENPDLKPFFQKKLELSVQDGCILWGNQVVISKAGREEVLNELHEAHPGATRMKRLARMFVWWPNLDADIEERVKKCQECQSNRPYPPLAPLQPWKWPTRPWARLHLDFAGPFMGHMYLVLIDSHSKWLEVIPLPSITAERTINSL